MNLNLKINIKERKIQKVKSMRNRKKTATSRNNLNSNSRAKDKGTVALIMVKDTKQIGEIIIKVQVKIFIVEVEVNNHMICKKMISFNQRKMLIKGLLINQ